MLWNHDFVRGRYGRADNTSEDYLYSFLKKYANKGSILDLGCGAGNTENELDVSAYHDCTGVDVSDEAIRRAKKRTEEEGRGEKNYYIQSDFFSYVPAQKFDVILFRDSIYYVALPRIKSMLDRYSKYLKERGVFIARIWSVGGKENRSADIIENNFDVIEKHLFGHQKMAIIVFRPWDLVPV
jgi:SAM-dependent methyltransferase